LLLLLLHHFFYFLVEDGGFNRIGHIILKSGVSALLSAFHVAGDRPYL
jgi:hypothetical protein